MEVITRRIDTPSEWSCQTIPTLTQVNRRADGEGPRLGRRETCAGPCGHDCRSWNRSALANTLPMMSALGHDLFDPQLNFLV